MADKSTVTSPGGRNYMRIVLIVAAAVLVFIMLFLAYRSIGFVAASSSYRCVEDTEDTVNNVNSLVDVESGLFLGETELILSSFEEAKTRIETREECTTGLAKVGTGQLRELQTEVDTAALEYIESMIAMVDDPENIEETIINATVTYKNYLDARSAYEDGLNDFEVKYFLSL